jgi:hypothetical protein
LTHRYSFNDGTARDSVGGADGTLVNGAVVADGVVSFDPTTNNGTNTSPATGQYVDLPNGLAKTRSLTLEAWFTYRGGSNWQRVVDFGKGSAGELPPSDKTTTGYSGSGYIILTPQNGAGKVTAQISIGVPQKPDTDYIYTSSPLPQNVEHHLVFTHDPDAQVEALYIDGVAAGTPGQTPGARMDPSVAEYYNFWLGRSNYYQDPFFNGTIDEFRIYDSALTAAEVQADFARGADVVPEPLAGATIGGALMLLGFLRPRRRTQPL